MAVCSSAPARAEKGEAQLYFGGGNFFRLQYELVMKEALGLGRRGGDISSVAGFAGGTEVGDLDRICYRAFPGTPNYAAMGHAQAVNVILPEDRVKDFAATYFDVLPKRKKGEKANEFRPMIGLKRGMKSPLLAAIKEASNGSWTLVEGEGNEKGAPGESVVYVYDTRYFPFRPAETYNQFADDIPDRFTNDYHELANVLIRTGTTLGNGCP